MPPIPYEQVLPHSAVLKIYTRPGIDPVIPVKDAAAAAGVHVQTLKNEAMRGKLKLIKVSERRIGVRESEWNRYLDARIWAPA